MIRKAGLLLMALGAMAFIISGCNTAGTKKTEWKPEEPVNRPPFIYTVKYPGETLRIISEWYTGDTKNREALADANPNLDYEHLAEGSRIYIPENLLRTTEPLTEEYIDAFNQKSKPKAKKAEEEKKKPVPKPVPSPKKEEDFDLVGPK